MTKYIIYICYFIDGDKMKRIILCIFCFLVIFIILFENYFTVSENNVVSEAERRSIFISYIEIGKYFEGKDKMICMKLSDLQNFCIRLLELEKSVK